MECTYEHDNLLSGTIKDGKRLDQMSDRQLLKKDSAPQSQLLSY